MRNVSFETTYTPEEVEKRINTLIDEKAPFEGEHKKQQFKGFCNTTTFKLAYYNQRFKYTNFMPKTINGTISNENNITSVNIKINTNIIPLVICIFLFIEFFSLYISNVTESSNVGIFVIIALFLLTALCAVLQAQKIQKIEEKIEQEIVKAVLDM